MLMHSTPVKRKVRVVYNKRKVVVSKVRWPNANFRASFGHNFSHFLYRKYALQKFSNFFGSNMQNVLHGLNHIAHGYND